MNDGLGNDMRRLVSFVEAAKMWGVSMFTVRRLAEAGKIVTVNVGARRLVPVTEIERVTKHGAGLPRRRKGMVTINEK